MRPPGKLNISPKVDCVLTDSFYLRDDVRPAGIPMVDERHRAPTSVIELQRRLNEKRAQIGEWLIATREALELEAEEREAFIARQNTTSWET